MSLQIKQKVTLSTKTKLEKRYEQTKSGDKGKIQQ